MSIETPHRSVHHIYLAVHLNIVFWLIIDNQCIKISKAMFHKAVTPFRGHLIDSSIHARLLKDTLPYVLVWYQSMSTIKH